MSIKKSNTSSRISLIVVAGSLVTGVLGGCAPAASIPVPDVHPWQQAVDLQSQPYFDVSAAESARLTGAAESFLSFQALRVLEAEVATAAAYAPGEPGIDTGALDKAVAFGVNRVEFGAPGILALGFDSATAAIEAALVDVQAADQAAKGAREAAEAETARVAAEQAAAAQTAATPKKATKSTSTKSSTSSSSTLNAQEQRRQFANSIAAQYGLTPDYGPNPCGNTFTRWAAGCFQGGSIWLSISDNAPNNSIEYVVKHEASHAAINNSCGTPNPPITGERYENIADAYAFVLYGSPFRPYYGYTDADVEIAKKISQGICE